MKKGVRRTHYMSIFEWCGVWVIDSLFWTDSFVLLRVSSCTLALTPVWFSLPQRSVRSTCPVWTVFWLETRTAPGTRAQLLVLTFSRMMLKNGEKWELTTTLWPTARLSCWHGGFYSLTSQKCADTASPRWAFKRNTFDHIIWPCSVLKTL